MEIGQEEARTLAGFAVRYIKLCNDDASFEEFDKWRADVRTRFPDQPEQALMKVQQVLKKFR